MGLITPLKTPVCNPGILRLFIEITSPFDTPRKFNSTEGHQGAVFKANFMQFSKLI